MEQRNLDFEIEMTRAQWEELGQSANAAPSQDESYEWDPERSDEIRVRVRKSDVPELWRDYITEDESYGEDSLEVARLHFNGGRPYASIDTPYTVDEPVYSEDEADGMRRELESWVRDKWHGLMRESGLHYDRGHIPQDEGDRGGMWNRLRADGCEWEIRAVPDQHVPGTFESADGQSPSTTTLEFQCLDDDRPTRRIAIETTELDRAHGRTLLELFREARDTPDEE